ncbi:MAG: HAMP domain-containing histidine kinase [Bdellovibrionaceae bacterium]|nr:HAMP domain-containing histidine kinase [Pseudobdellovibrionaceae bacterium]MBX3034892.1 HAMP domain-containing histidine kinase [Pseudobdellovibrionaceae bacterium]
MKFTLFRKALLFSTLSIILFAVLGSLTSFLLREAEFMRPSFSPFALSFAQMVDKMAEKTELSKADALKLLEETRPGFPPPTPPPRDNGRDFRPPPPPPFPRPAIRLLGAAQARELLEEGTALPAAPYEHAILREVPGEEARGPWTLVRLKGPDAQFLLLNMRPPPPPRGMGGPLFLLNFVILVGSVALGSIVSFTVLFYSMRARAESAREVMNQMQNGNLKARIPVGKVDEVGHLIIEFNKMSDEIEQLVGRISKAEESRRLLLQDLAHDLRTPIASMKSMLETLSTEKVDPRTSQELMQLSLREIEYFSRLVEDLLFLARVTEPRYKTNVNTVPLQDLLLEEAEQVEARHQSGAKNIRLSTLLPEEGIEIQGDERLLQRLFRNAFENAFSHARQQVVLESERRGDQLWIRVADDGPGLDAGVAESFGEKRPTRIQDSAQKGRLSVGLGSVIMKAVMDAHGGTMKIENILDPDGHTRGARLSLCFRITHPRPS